MSKEFIFIPKVGDTTKDCYLHGATSLDHIGNEGIIEFVGSDYFILRDTDKYCPLIIRKESYWVIGEGDFE